MATYEIQVQNPNTKSWETKESGGADSRRKFLKKFDRNSMRKTQWRCVKM